MPQKKQNRHQVAHHTHPLKRVLHPNRHFIWAIILACLVLGGLAAFILITDMNESSNNGFSSVTHPRTYTNVQQGYSIEYRGDWVVEVSNSGAVTFDNPQNAADQVNVTGVLTAADIAKFRTDSKTVVEEQTTSNGMQFTLVRIAPDQGGGEAMIITAGSKSFIIGGPSTEEFLTFARNFKVLK